MFNLEDVGQNNLTQNINLLVKWKYNIEDRYKSEWLHALNANSDSFKLRTYAKFKTDFNIENYLLSIKCINSRILFTKLRISAHDLLIEMGRYNKPKKTPVENRLCCFCKSNNIEVEPHTILHCSIYNDLFSNLDNIFFNFTTMDQDEQFKFIMSANNGGVNCCKLVSDFIENCYVLRNHFDLKNK